MKIVLAFSAALAAAAVASPASAADFVPGDPQFQVFGNPFTGTDPVSATIGNGGLSGSGSDSYFFAIGPATGEAIGLGSGSISTSFSSFGQTSFSFDSVTFNNGSNVFVVPITALGGGSGGALANIPIFSGVVNTLTVNYTATGNASYGGQLTFIPGGIPEPMTWSLMILGFAAVGFAMRRKKKETVRVRYAF